MNRRRKERRKKEKTIERTNWCKHGRRSEHTDTYKVETKIIACHQADSAGNVYLLGYTGGNLDSQSNAASDGSYDIFLAKFAQALAVSPLLLPMKCHELDRETGFLFVFVMGAWKGRWRLNSTGYKVHSATTCSICPAMYSELADLAGCWFQGCCLDARLAGICNFQVGGCLPPGVWPKVRRNCV